MWYTQVLFKSLAFILRKPILTFKKLIVIGLRYLKCQFFLFIVDDKNQKSWFFKKRFLLVNINIDITFEIFFLILNNIEIDLNNQKLNLRSYITIKTLSIIKLIKFVRKKEFIDIIFNLDDKIFVVHIISFSSLGPIYAFYRV